MSFIRNIFTELDNQTYSSGRVAAFLLLATFIGLSIADFVMNKKFDGYAFGIGGGATVGSMAAAIRLSETKP